MDESMNFQKLIIGTVVTLIVLSVIGAVWHFAIFSKYYSELSFARNPSELAYIAVTDLIRAFSITWLFLKCHKEGARIMEGLVFGLMIGLLTVTLWAFANYATLQLPKSWIPMEAAFVMLQSIPCGLSLAMMNLTEDDVKEHEQELADR